MRPGGGRGEGTRGEAALAGGLSGQTAGSRWARAGQHVGIDESVLMKSPTCLKAAGPAGWAGPGPCMRADPGVAGRGRALHGLGQIAAGLLIFGVYLAVAHIPHFDLAAANARGHGLLQAEQWLEIDAERAANRWLAGQPVMAVLAAWEYAVTYVVTTFAVLGWVWWRRQRDYPWARNTLLWTTLAAIACFAAWPTTPPRLLHGSGFSDIVAIHHPFLSWGSGAVSAGANQFAAMPSLHVGWAVWVTAVSLRVRAAPLGNGLAVLHVVVTVAVVMATANHYLLDVVGGAMIAGLAVGAEQLRAGRASRDRGERVAAPDEFFLHVESATVQQTVGGFVILDTGHTAKPPELADFRRLLARRIDGMPRFRQRLRPAGRWRHAQWVPADVDLGWHVREYRLAGRGGRDALAEQVSRLAERQLDRSRPLWQIWFVPNVGPAEAAVVAIVHHAVADGLGVVDTLRQLFDPLLPEPDLSGIRQPPRPLRAVATMTGLIQLAADGGADQLPFVLPLSGRRRYRFAATPLAPVRELARSAGCRVTDVLLAALGQALAEVLAARGAATEDRWLRAAVPLTTRPPAPAGTGRRAEAGNRTTALRLDVPLGQMPPLERLRRVSAGARARHRSGRGMAAALVMRLMGILPPAAHRLAARGVYTGRHLTAIVSNMPGPVVGLSMAGAPVRDTYPILPLADRVPLGVGTLGWAGWFCLAVITDPAALPEADVLAARIIEVVEQMQQETRPEAPRPLGDGPASGEGRDGSSAAHDGTGCVRAGGG